VSRANLAGLEFGKLALTETAQSLRNRGVAFDADVPPEAPAVLIELAGSAGPEYRVGFTNFYAITRYNRSQLYASAVNDLAEAIAAKARPVSAPSSPAPASATAKPTPAVPPPFTSIGK